MEKSLGKFLQSQREKGGLKGAAMARELDNSPAAVGQLERRSDVSTKSIRMYAKALNIPLDEMYLGLSNYFKST